MLFTYRNRSSASGWAAVMFVGTTTGDACGMIEVSRRCAGGKCKGGPSQTFSHHVREDLDEEPGDSFKRHD